MRRELRGIACMVAGCALVTFNDGILKWLTTDYPVGQIMFVRSVFVFPAILLLAVNEGGLARLRVHNPKGQAVRAAIVVTGMFLFVTAISLMPIADALAIAFASPLVATALAVPMLGERVGWRRWSAVAVGLAGVAVALKPGTGTMAAVALLPLAAAFTGALRDIVTRRLSVSDSSSSILMVTTAAVMVAGLASALAGPLGFPGLAWRAMPAVHITMLAAAGLLLAGAQYLMIEAVRLAEVGLVSPFKYTSMVWAVLLGYLVYGTVPDIWVATGSLLVVASGLYVVRREARLASRRRSFPTRPDSPPLPGSRARPR